MRKKVPNKQQEKTYTGSDLMEETMKMLQGDDIGKKIPKDQLLALSKILVKTIVKGDL